MMSPEQSGHRGEWVAATQREGREAPSSLDGPLSCRFVAETSSGVDDRSLLQRSPSDTNPCGVGGMKSQGTRGDTLN